MAPPDIDAASRPEPLCGLCYRCAAAPLPTLLLEPAGIGSASAPHLRYNAHTPLIRYAAAEGDLWEEGLAFQRTNTAEVQALVAKGNRMFVARAAPSLPAATAAEVARPRPALVAGCVSFAPVSSTIGGVEATVAEFGLLCVAPEHRRLGLAGPDPHRIPPDSV